MNEALQSNNHHSRTLLIAILICFAILTGARLNHIYLVSPDSGDYILMARGLSTSFEYRQFDFPGEPYFTVRPPGMSVLLIPAALIAPYNAILAKVTVIFTSIIMLTLLYLFMCRLQNFAGEASPKTKQSLHWPALFIILLLATNPYILLFSTLIMSEIPFMAFTIAILYLISHDEEQVNKRKLVLLTCLVMFLPLIRTIGVALVLALGMWAIVKRKRWPYLISVICSFAVTGLWMLRNNSFKSDVYSAATMGEMKSMGVLGTFLSMLNRSLIHFESLCQKLFPSMPGVIPSYERFVLDGNHVLPGPQFIYYLGSIFIISIAIYGMLKCWNRGGAVSFFYMCITFGILSIWPWMQARYIFPLLPVILAFLPVGFVCIVNRLSKQNETAKKVIMGLVVLLGIGLFVSQAKTDYSMIYANQKLIFQGDEFYETEFPSNHYSDFVAAGNWIKNNTAANARVLTRRNDVATTGHRFQKQIHFEQKRPNELHTAIQTFAPQYLVSFDKTTVGAFPWHLLDHDLVYRLTPVYEKKGVVIIEIQPNYEGTIRHQYWQKDEPMDIAREAFDKFPNRLSSQVNYLQQLLQAEKYDAAISFVKELPEVSDVRIVNFLGWAYVGKHQFKQALQEFTKATRMPGQRLISQSIRRGMMLSEKRLADKNGSGELAPSETPKNNLRIAEEYWKLAHFDKAHEYTQKVLDSDNASKVEIEKAHLLMARLHLINGRTAQALEELNRIQSTENQEANRLLDMIKLEKSIASLFEIGQLLDQRQLDSLFQLVSIYQAEGVPGKALKLLAQAHELAPENLEVLKLLAKYQLFYHKIPEAEANYLTLQKTMPEDQEIKDALTKIETLQKAPHF
ncbi:hypothetical protein [Gimesia aquarii]|uniref:Tetratricopeptide repeat protein n=1 Tax=Gimesia aquarii TaxID=2527964 RepID=A0A517WSD4_9PLAN|nr:hypothetical protein [Gimesia aquarii]QDU08138.1 Tetratricopeptide repeat protein [Gimesia aquarii]